jgi:hypothetical protein
MGTSEGLTFVTPNLAFGTGCPDIVHMHASNALVAARWMRDEQAKMVVVRNEDQARETLAKLGLDPALIDDRIHFGQTGRIGATS